MADHFSNIMFSSIQKRSSVSFAAFAAEKIYMLPFLQKDGLPSNVKHWQPTVDAMLDGVKTDCPIYLMVDQQVCKAGQIHRRPGIHVDGYWNPGGHHGSISAHGGGHGGGTRPSHSGGGHLGHSGYGECLMLASNVEACVGYEGEYQRNFEKEWNGGDCSNIDISNLRKTVFEKDSVYAGYVFMLHESVAVPFDCHRTVVRLNVPNAVVH